MKHRRHRISASCSCLKDGLKRLIRDRGSQSAKMKVTMAMFFMLQKSCAKLRLVEASFSTAHNVWERTSET